MSPMMILGLLILISALAAYILWQRSRRLRAQSGLPRGKIVYADMERARPVRSERWRLIGKPDFIIETRHGPIPVEVKSAALPRSGQPYPGHVLQLAAYCLLVEETFGTTPPFGYIRYRDGRTVQVPFTPELKRELLRTLQAMHAAEQSSHVGRSHQAPWKCERCGLAYICGSERLVP